MEVKTEIKHQAIARFDACSQIKKGEVGQLYVRDNQIVLNKSDGTCPLGVVVRKVRIRDKKTRRIKRHVAEVLFRRALIKTTNFDPQVRYPVGANLFIDRNGTFTTRQHDSSDPAVAIVISPPNAIDSCLELIWM